MKSRVLRLVAAVLLGLIVAIFPLPETLTAYRPPFCLLIFLYTQFFLPSHFSLILITLTGLCLDALLRDVLGAHVFALALALWLANSKALRFRFFSMPQQMALTGLFCFFYELPLLFVSLMTGFQLQPWSLLINSLLGILCWPWIKILLDDLLHPASLLPGAKAHCR